MFKKDDASKNGLKGGIMRGVQQRTEAIERYFANPRYCEYCNVVIPVLDGQHVYAVLKRRFCGKSCAMKSKRNNGITKGGAPKPIIVTMSKEALLERELSKLTNLTGLRKGEVGNQVTHSKISNTARRTYVRSGKSLACAVCGYTKHVQICHKKSVASFPATELISVINDIKNLVPLCPNHHWEFDHNAMDRGDLLKIAAYA